MTMNHPQQPHPADPNRPVIPPGRPSDFTGGGQYFGGKDCESGRTHLVTIASIGWENLTDGRGQTDQYLVCHFREDGSKGLVLKPETMKSMLEAIGVDDFGAWIGRQVEIFGVPTSMGLGARARRPQQVAAPMPYPAIAQPYTPQPAATYPQPAANAYSQPVTPQPPPQGPPPSDIPF
jgi:hypothetical protein